MPAAGATRRDGEDLDGVPAIDAAPVTSSRYWLTHWIGEARAKVVNLA